MPLSVNIYNGNRSNVKLTVKAKKSKDRLLTFLHRDTTMSDLRIDYNIEPI